MVDIMSSWIQENAMDNALRNPPFEFDNATDIGECHVLTSVLDARKRASCQDMLEFEISSWLLDRVPAVGKLFLRIGVRECWA